MADKDQQKYREYFGIEELYLIHYDYDPDKTDSNKDGYIVFIDKDCKRAKVTYCKA